MNDMDSIDSDYGLDDSYFKIKPICKEKTKKEIRTELKKHWKDLLKVDEELCNEILIELRLEKIKKIKK